jgi:hypothetical protein
MNAQDNLTAEMGLSQQKMDRIYKAHCFTFAIARAVNSMQSKLKGRSLDGGLKAFRASPGKRDANAQDLRDKVAAQVKSMRRELALMV